VQSDHRVNGDGAARGNVARGESNESRTTAAADVMGVCIGAEEQSGQQAQKLASIFYS
jgi:hypothetical protein